jgi:hypothetical protein
MVLLDKVERVGHGSADGMALPATLQSRAKDEVGNTQPSRARFGAQRGELKKVLPVLAFPNRHFNAVTS